MNNFVRLLEKVKIKVKNPGLLEIPKGKNFWDMPISHYEALVDSKGYEDIIRGLVNLQVWNKDDNPDIAEKAKAIAAKLRKKYRGKKGE